MGFLLACGGGKPPPPPTPTSNSLTFASAVNAIAYTPDGGRLVVGLADGTIHVHDTMAGQETTMFTAHPGDVAALAVLPDGKRLLSAGADGKVCLWESASGKSLRTFEAQAGAVETLSVAGDGSTFAALTKDGSVRVWDEETAKVLCTLPGAAKPDDGLALSPDGKTLVIADQDALTFLDPTTGAKVANLPAVGYASSGHMPASAAYSKDGEHLVVACSGFAVLDSQSRKMLSSFKNSPVIGHVKKYHVRQALLSADKQSLVCRTGDSVVVWDKPLQAGTILRKEMVLSSSSTCFALNPDSITIAVGCTNGNVLFYDLTKIPDLQNR
jgi:WD40 repeat protein